MTRRLLLVALAVAAFLAVAVPAQAAFTSTTTSGTVAVSTTVVTPPTTVTARLDSCSNGRWMNVTVAWTASTTAKVSAYVIRAYRSNGQVTTVAETTGTATSTSTTVDKFNAGGTAFTVTARTSYGWTAESARTVSLTC